MRWLHLCDLHLGRQDDAQSVAMAQLIDAISNAVGREPLDFIVFAGDLAYSGQEEEYKVLVSDIIEPLRLIPAAENAQLISVPGNHDLDCTGTYPIIWDGLGQARQSIFWNAGEQGQQLRLNRAKGFASYGKFLSEQKILGPCPLVEVGALVEMTGDPTVSLICLNTALFSDKEFSEIDEKGKSPLPVQVLRQLAAGSPSGAQIIVIGHHPLNWFEVQSRNQFQSALTDLSAFYLHGHEHRVDVTFGPNYLRSLGFGATYPGRLDGRSQQPYTSTFTVCVLEDQLHVEFTAWDPSQGVWRPLHTSLPSDVRDRSGTLRDGYVIPIPTTRSTTLSVKAKEGAGKIQSRHLVERPIWIEGDRTKTWAALLYDIGLIEQADATTEEEPHQVPSHSRFLIKDQAGTHLVHTATAETSVITYDHVESANTQIDTLHLRSCVIATFGTITAAARNLANNLRRTKNLEVLDGDAISERLQSGPFFAACRQLFSETESAVSFTPLAVRQGLVMLVVDAVQNRWFSIVTGHGVICVEHDDLVSVVREKLPHLKTLRYRVKDVIVSVANAGSGSGALDRSHYLERCLTLFDTAQYAGLAAMGIRMQVESLRKIYVPTSANVEQQQEAVKATERAIDELVETLGLDEHQRDQLSRQMKAKYGLQNTSEVGAASKLYQNFSNVMVLGDPGSGKSCFVRSEILSYCAPDQNGNGDWYEQHVPVFLPLTEYVYSSDSPVGLVEQCSRHARGQGLALEVVHIEALLARGQVALFFDGLDEVSSIAGRQRVLSELEALVEKYAAAGNRFVLTSRPAAVRDAALPTALARVSLLGLTDEEISTLVHRLFEVRNDGSISGKKADEKVIGDILRDCAETPGIRRLARNPLLLTLLVFVYENSGAFAARRHLIYSQAIKTLVSVRHREIQRAKLSESDLRVRLGKVAKAMFRREESALPTRENVLRILSGVMEGDDGRGSDFVQDVAETTGLVIIHPRTKDKRGDLISFMHYSFLEYYTAVGFLDDDEGFSTVAEFALNQRWREVVTLMFGILGEQADITENVKLLCHEGGLGDGITVSRLLLAFDCALECDVPPEGTQKFLAEEVDKVLATGAGMYVSEVREQLGERIGLLMEATGSRFMREVLLEGISSGDERRSAAFVEMIAGMGGPFCDEEETVLAIGRALERDERILNQAVINALRALPALRSDRNLGRVAQVLRRGGIIEKTAVLQLLEEQPALIGSFEGELREQLYGENDILAAGAASAVIRGDLFRKDEYTDLAMFDRALQEVMSNDAPRKSLTGVVRIPWDVVEEWIFSPERKLRERGFRCLSVVETDAAKVHDLLFRCLRTEEDDVVVTAMLNTLSVYSGAIQAASLAETDQVCRLTKSKYSNVRRAAARALRSFPTMEAVTRALIDQFHQLGGRYNREMRDVVRAMAAHAVRDKASRAVIGDEIIKILRMSDLKWNTGNIAYVSELLFAGEQFDVEMKEGATGRLLAIARDFRSPAEVRRLAMRLYGQTCARTGENLLEIVREFSGDDSSRRLSAYRAGRRLVQRCRGRFETVQMIVGGLEEARAGLLKCWEREVASVGERGDGAAVREIRNFLIDIESTLGAYQEFSDRVTIEELEED